MLNDSFIGFVAIFAGLIVLEVIARKTKIPENIMRKTVHVATAITIICLCIFISFKAFIFIGFAFTLILLIARRTKLLHSLRDRAKESYGEVLFPIGVSVSALITHTTTDFITIIAVLGFADTVAYIIGRNIKSPKLRFNKTTAGSLGFLISTFTILLFVAPPLPAILMALFLTATEAFSPSGTDNASVPIFASLLLVAS